MESSAAACEASRQPVARTKQGIPREQDSCILLPKGDVPSRVTCRHTPALTTTPTGLGLSLHMNPQSLPEGSEP